jgi:hypothetical protein
MKKKTAGLSPRPLQFGSETCRLGSEVRIEICKYNSTQRFAEVLLLSGVKGRTEI